MVVKRDDARRTVTISEVASGGDVNGDLVVGLEQFELMTGGDSASLPGQTVSTSVAPVIEKSDLDGAVFDLTGCPRLRLAPNMHALLVVGHDDNSVTVKDPNLGNAEIKLRIDQIREMAVNARTGRPGSVQSYRPAGDGQDPPRIHELADDVD
jgi:hypothetical protein